MQWALFSSHLIWFLCRSWPWCRPHHFWKLLSFLDTFDVTLSCFSYLGQLFFFFFLFIKPSSFYFSKMILSICLYLLKTNLMNTNLFPTLSSWINEISSYLLNTCIWISSSCADTNSCKVHFIVYPSNLEFILRPVLWKRSCEPAEVLKPDNLRAALSYSFLVVPLFCAQPQGQQTHLNGLCPPPGEITSQQHCPNCSPNTPLPLLFVPPTFPPMSCQDDLSKTRILS